MDRLLALSLRTLALGCGCIAAILALAGFIEFLQVGRWPDQSLLRFAYDHRLLNARWFLQNDWSLPLRHFMAWLPLSLAALVLAPLCWWLGGLSARR